MHASQIYQASRGKALTIKSFKIFTERELNSISKDASYFFYDNSIK